jgi:hypothetical protein
VSTGDDGFGDDLVGIAAATAASLPVDVAQMEINQNFSFATWELGSLSNLLK